MAPAVVASAYGLPTSPVCGAVSPMPAASMRNEITPSAARPRARSTAMRALPQRGLALVLTISTAGASCVGQSGVDRIPNRDSPGPKRTGVSRAPPTLSDVALFGTATRDKPVAAGWDITQRTMRSKAVCGTSAACELRCMRFRSWNTSNVVVVPASCNDSASASTAGRLSDSIKQRIRRRWLRQFTQIERIQRIARRAVDPQAVRFKPYAIVNLVVCLPDTLRYACSQSEFVRQLTAADGTQQHQGVDSVDLARSPRHQACADAIADETSQIRRRSVQRNQATPASMLCNHWPNRSRFVIAAGRVAGTVIAQP